MTIHHVYFFIFALLFSSCFSRTEQDSFHRIEFEFGKWYNKEAIDFEKDFYNAALTYVVSKGYPNDVILEYINETSSSWSLEEFSNGTATGEIRKKRLIRIVPKSFYQNNIDLIYKPKEPK